MRCSIPLVALVLIGCGPRGGTVTRNERSVPAPLPIRSCSEAEGAAARVLMADFGAAVDAIRDQDDAMHLTQRFEAMLAAPCFDLAVENPRLPTFARGIQARTWWTSGGQDWLEDYVEPGEFTVVPPDVIPVLAVDGQPPHRLGALLCQLGDTACGRETAGWVLRANEWWRNAYGNPGESECHKEARQQVPDQRYRTWRTCLEAERPRQPLLPLGRFRAPVRGWFLIWGKRRSHGTCRELRLYSLSSGATYLVRECRATSKRSRDSESPTFQAGTVPVDALREAAWMTMLASEVVSPVQIAASMRQMPPDVVRTKIPPIDNVVYLTSDTMQDSSMTQLSWSWFDDGQSYASGSLIGPYSHKPGDNYADHLWRVAEAASRVGCAPEMLPAKFPGDDWFGSKQWREAQPRFAHGLEALRQQHLCSEGAAGGK